jgi:hypothetical protein
VQKKIWDLSSIVMKKMKPKHYIVSKSIKIN